MVVIRLSRGGAKKRPFYNIVVADSREARDGRYIEQVGYFNPIARGGEIRLLVKEERVTHWASLGAQPSDRVISLLKEYKKQASGKEAEEMTKSAKKKTSQPVNVQAQDEQTTSASE